MLGVFDKDGFSPGLEYVKKRISCYRDLKYICLGSKKIFNQKHNIMKKSFTFLCLFFSFISLFGQLRLDVEGDAKIRGNLDLSSIDGSSLFIGSNAGKNDDGDNSNTFLGITAGRNNISGFSNTFVGKSAGSLNINGFENTFVGNAAGLQNTSGGFRLKCWLK